MNFVWTLGGGSQHHDAELAFSMRSVQRFVPGTHNFTVVGSKPQCNPGVRYTWIETFDEGGNKSRNIANNVLRGAQAMGSSDYIHMDDDIFFIKPVEAPHIPVLRAGSLLSTLEYREDLVDTYTNTLRATRDQLALRNLPGVDYEVHAPVPVHAPSFVSAMSLFDFNTDPAPCWRSCYYNLFPPKRTLFQMELQISEPMTVRQIDEKLSRARAATFSCGDGAFHGELMQYLEREYPL